MCNIKRRLSVLLLILFLSITANAADESNQAFLLGVFHPTGFNMLGYSVETEMKSKLYWYYAFGFPTVAAVGINYYSNRDSNGWTGNLGAGLGFWLYGSIAYQMKIGNKNFLKLGAAAALALETSNDSDESDRSLGVQPYPIIAYEHRF